MTTTSRHSKPLGLSALAKRDWEEKLHTLATLQRIPGTLQYPEEKRLKITPKNGKYCIDGIPVDQVDNRATEVGLYTETVEGGTVLVIYDAQRRLERLIDLGKDKAKDYVNVKR